MTTPADTTLYERWLLNRDGDAFAELARRHSGVVYDLAVRYSGDAVLAEDLVQEALLDLALAGSRKPIEVGFVAWMARFAMCRARNVRASERARRKRQQTVGERRREDVPMPDDHLEREDELQRALERAEPDERVVLAMRYLHGWEYGRIASALSISEGAARVRVHRALGALRSRLGVDLDAEAVAANNGRKNGKAAYGAPLLGLLGELPLHRMPDGLLEMGVQNAIEAATAVGAAGGGGAASFAPRVGRLTLQALGLSALLGAATAVSLTAGSTSPVSAELAPRLAHLASAMPVGEGGARHTLGADGDRHTGGIPRPPEWDDGVLSRLRSRTGSESTQEVAVAAEPATAPEDEPPAAPFAPAPLPIEREPVEVLRPTSRDTRAATRDPVSSDDERAGIPAGRLAPTHGPPDLAAATAPEPAPGLPAELRDPSPGYATSTLPLADRRLVALVDLPPEQAELVHEAANLVALVVAPEGGALGELVTDRRRLRRQSKALRKEYRRARRGLRQAAFDENADAFARETTRAAQVATAQYVLKLLLEVVMADGRTAAELVWPDGADVTAALQDVVDALGTLVPDGLAGGGSATELEGAATSEILPNGALPDGALAEPVSAAGGAPEDLE